MSQSHDQNPVERYKMAEKKSTLLIPLGNKNTQMSPFNKNSKGSNIDVVQFLDSFEQDSNLRLTSNLQMPENPSQESYRKLMTIPHNELLSP
jgi:hypothetical protein